MDEDVPTRGRITVHLQEPTPDGSGVVESEVLLSTDALGAVELPELLRRLQERASAGAHGWLDADEIVTGLWQGAAPPPGRVLQKAGYTLLVLCAQEIQPPAEVYPGVRVVHAPNEDSPSLPEERERIARMAADTVAEEVRRGGRALVTCAAGLNRSGLVTGLALHQLSPRTRMDDLIGRMRRRRPLALSNPYFAAWLRELDSEPAEEAEAGG